MKIEKYLVLNKYLLSLFGVTEFKELQEKLKDTQEGIDSDGRSYFLNVLISSFTNLKVNEGDLLKYDENIQDYVKKVNYRRNNISLKYFQYLAVLFTEIFLDFLKNKKQEFLYELNEFLEKYKKEEEIDLIEKFTEDDLKKLAFWMATGSGKTIIMHINYYQFLKYNLFIPDNIILITPNEGLSKQHFDELLKSGIPAKLYSGGQVSGIGSTKDVLVIEMTKFVEEKKGGGVTLPVDTFEGKNLIFVDEGHKGKKSDEQKWAKLRDKLAENGFVFEYSATFAQILSKSQPEVLQEYAKSIIFDYSYRYFYLDGYGKNFSVHNVKDIKVDEIEFQETMFVANLLSFYEQLLVYEENINLVKQYNIEKPLWIFVGTTVVGKKNKKLTEDEKKELSDVVQILKFINKVIKDEDWLKQKIKKILEGKTNLKNENGEDIFSDKFLYLKKNGLNLEDIYRRIFRGKGQLEIFELKNVEGEFGLKIAENDYFGVINIGASTDFKKQLELKEYTIKQDAISSSLFDDIRKDECSKINILIGSKKFIEGWDTWRVSSMGLLNIGKGQGPQIIQLFGRGVRLKGKGMSLKRSGDSPQIQILETLNIFGIKANYLQKFLEEIRKEEIEFETIEIPIQLQHKDKWKTLYTLTKNEKVKFEDEKIIKLEIDPKIHFKVDLLPKISTYTSSEKRDEIKVDQVKSDIQEWRITQNELDLIDFEKLWQEICNFKITKGYWNLILDKETIKNLLLSDIYKILILPDILEINDQKDVEKLEEVALLVIKKYIELFYKKHARAFETDNLYYEILDNRKQQMLLPFVSEKYTLQINKNEKKLIEEIKKLKNNLNKLLNEESNELPRIYFDSHLYLPILIKSKKIDKISPEGLVESEVKFIIELRDYLKAHKDKFKNYEIYLLRNFPKTGVGFQLQWFGFYPDFIMWVKQKYKQKIIFIDPKGLEHTKGLDDEKIIFAGFKPQGVETITVKDIEKKLNNQNISLESFILSATEYDKLVEGIVSAPSKEEYERKHVLFLNDKDWTDKFFEIILKLQ